MSIELIAYHGTFEKNVTTILEKGFTYQEREDHWLGNGIYFYTSLDLAKWWIETKSKKGLDKNIAVIQVNIKVDAALYLNLDSNEGMVFFVEKSQELLNRLNVKFKFVQEDTYKNLCFLLDLIKREYQIKVVQHTFLKYNPSYAQQSVESLRIIIPTLPNSFAYRETQICVVDNQYIESKVVLQNVCCIHAAFFRQI